MRTFKQPKQAEQQPVLMRHRARPRAGSAGEHEMLEERLNQSPRVQTQLMLQQSLNQSPRGAAHRGPASTVIQRRWNESDGGKLVWSEPINGLLWYYDPESETMSFQQQSDSQVPEGAKGSLEELQGKWLPYGTWLEMGWGLFPTGPAVEIKEFGPMLEKGSQRYEQMTAAMKKTTGGQVHPETQAARDDYFAKYYKTEPKVHGPGELEIRSEFKHPPVKMKEANERDIGHYFNQVNLEKGLMTASHNYALEASERYYDPVSGKPARMSNSEILFQQWKKAEESTGMRGRMRYLKRSRIAGDGLLMVKTILKETGKTKAEEPVYKEGEPGFLALFSVPNVTSAIWLVVDHGQELGIRGINSIQITNNLSALIEFQ